MKDLEFLLTNKTGGYSSSTLNDGNTRKYHALLAVDMPDLARYNILNRIEDTLTIRTNSYPLSTIIYKDNMKSPDSSVANPALKIEDVPVWDFSLPEVRVNKSLVLAPGENILQLRYKIKAEAEFELTIEPFVTFRNVHAVSHHESAAKIKQHQNNEQLLLELEPGKFLQISAAGFNYEPEAVVYRDFFYPQEQRRGYESLENLIRTGKFSINLPSGEHELNIYFSYSEGRNEPSPKEADCFKAAAADVKELVEQFHKLQGLAPSELSKLAAAQANHFVIRHNGQPSVIAGYHWFDDWGRDTFISFKGLLLETGRVKEAKELLLRWIKLESKGFLPNRPYIKDYNSLDAVLWFAYALWCYYEQTLDKDTALKAIPMLEDVVSHFHEGSRGIKVNESGFLENNNEDSAWTWMDAQIDGKPVTPRNGCAVEIQALWYNLLKILLQLKLTFNDRTFLTQIRKTTVLLEKNFEKEFWNLDAECLYDLINGEHKDTKIRPNQLIVLYLPFELLGKRSARKILQTATWHLLCEGGLYSLSKYDPDFKSAYKGDQKSRDLAYHNGTIWPFLLGYYLIAVLKFENDPEKVKKILASFYAKLRKAEAAYIPELFDQESLEPAGCISQAWSVALLLETIVMLNKQKQVSSNDTIMLVR